MFQLCTSNFLLHFSAKLACLISKRFYLLFYSKHKVLSRATSLRTQPLLLQKTWDLLEWKRSFWAAVKVSLRSNQVGNRSEAAHFGAPVSQGMLRSYEEAFSARPTVKKVDKLLVRRPCQRARLPHSLCWSKAICSRSASSPSRLQSNQISLLSHCCGCLPLWKLIYPSFQPLVKPIFILLSTSASTWGSSVSPDVSVKATIFHLLTPQHALCSLPYFNAHFSTDYSFCFNSPACQTLTRLV